MQDDSELNVIAHLIDAQLKRDIRHAGNQVQCDVCGDWVELAGWIIGPNASEGTNRTIRAVCGSCMELPLTTIIIAIMERDVLRDVF